MTRPLLRFLHHRQFRLLVRWKGMLLARDAFRVPHLASFPHRLVIQVFEEIVHLLKCAAAGHPIDGVRGRPIIDAQTPALTADQYAEILWAGREVLVEFVDGETCVSRFDDAARRALHGNLQRIFVGLVEREIRELHRLEAERNDAMMIHSGIAAARESHELYRLLALDHLGADSRSGVAESKTILDPIGKFAVAAGPAFRPVGAPPSVGSSRLGPKGNRRA